jgi:hypothetical protein
LFGTFVPSLVLLGIVSNRQFNTERFASFSYLLPILHRRSEDSLEGTVGFPGVKFKTVRINHRYKVQRAICTRRDEILDLMRGFDSHGLIYSMQRCLYNVGSKMLDSESIGYAIRYLPINWAR